MMNEGAIVTNIRYMTGKGRYAYNLYNLGLVKNFLYLNFYNNRRVFYFNYENRENYKTLILNNNRGSLINTFFSIINLIHEYYIGGIYKKAIEKYDFVHFTDELLFYLAKYNKNAIGTLHDFFPITYPQNKLHSYFFKMNLKYISKLKAVVVISDRTKKEAEERFPDVYFKRIHLWLDDPNFRPRDKIEVRKKLGLKEDKIYLLNVSTDYPQKNIDILPNILNKLNERFVLIRIGDSERILPKFKNKNQIIWLKNVSDEIYALYFNAADVLIHPALDGGFEIPYLEAIFSDLPIITFDIPIAKEVLRDKGIYVHLGKDKLDPYEWVDKILKYYDHKPNYDDLKKYYSKERAKREYENLYRSLGFL